MPAPVTSRDVAKGAGTTLLARLGALLEVIAQPLYVAMFGLASFGLYAVLWAAVNLAENILDLGMTSSMQRVVPQAKSEAEAVSALRASILLGVGPCLIAAVLVSIGADRIAPLFNTAEADQAYLIDAIRLFAWALPLWAFIEIATSALRARRAFGPEIRLRVFWEQLVRLLLAIVFWAGGLSTMALFVAHLVSLSVICVLCVQLLAKHFDLRLLFKGRVTDRVFHESWRAGLSVLPANIVARLFSDGPPLALNWLLPGSAGAIAGGLFAIARKVSSLVQTVRIAFAYVLAPLASAATQGHEDEVRNIYGFATRVSLAVAAPIGMVLAASSPPILALFGREAAAAVPALVILLVARAVEATLGAAAPIQQVVSRYRDQLLPSVAGLGVAAALAFFLMPEGGLTGMAIAVAAGFVVAAVLPVIQLWAFDGLHPFAAPFLKVLLITALISLAGLALAEAWLWTPLWVQLPLALLTTLAALWLSARFALPLHDREALGKTGRALKLA
jgi:O-antigen/teichoic acid export membrane protein